LATSRKSERDYPGYLADQNRKPFTPTAREEELLQKTVHPDELKEALARIETLEVRFNELCRMLERQLANSGFLLLKIEEP